MGEFAERERCEGYMDGLDPDTPEPSANRSHSYRHGFECGRADRQSRPAFGGYQQAVAHAEQAELKDTP